MSAGNARKTARTQRVRDGGPVAVRPAGQRTVEQLIKRPVVSEKSYEASRSGRYVFRCRLNAEKIEIKRAVEQAFADQKITVVSVNTMRVRGKERQRSRGSHRIIGHSPHWKKAIVQLAPGQKLAGFFEDV